MAISNDPDSVRRAAGGDRRALDALWREHRRWVAVVVTAHKPAEAELEDLLQEVALSFVRSIGSLRDPARLRPWLRSIALNAARSAGRRAGTRRKFLTRLGPSGLQVPDPAAERSMRRTEEAIAVERVLAALEGLAPEYREPLMLRSVRGMTQREIAETLEMEVTTVETRLSRGRRMLRERLRERPPDTAAAGTR